MNHFIINTEKIHEKFIEHLQLEENKRIVISGKFGTGKTYFIKEFFKNQKEYDYTYLSPVNYQVAKNEDIFELIKYDILLEFIGKEIINSQNEDFSEFLSMQFYLLNNSSDLVLDLISLIPKLGKTTPVIKKLVTFIRGYKNYVDNINKSEIDIVEGFASLIENEKGSIYETDFITKLIFELQTRILDKEKESVLVIDDLDRIEPEHIFRILNIFSSHYSSDEQVEENNKFGFKKVILICDIENIRKIFYSKYGQDVDFSGYIDKFYSKTCFIFNNTPSILKSVEDIFKPFYEANNKFKLVIDLIHVLKYFFTDFIKSNSINIRDLENIPLMRNPFANKIKFEIDQNFKFESQTIPMILVIFAIREILGNDDYKVIHCFKNCQENLRESVIKNRLELIQYLIPFINVQQTDFVSENSQSTTITELGLDIKFNFQHTHDFNLGSIYKTKILSITQSTNKEEQINNISTHNFYFLLEKIYNNVMNINQIEN